MKRRFVIAAGIATVTLAAILLPVSQLGRGRVFRVDAPYPTETKPQSKLWYAQDRWWAWLPDGTGGSIWKRGPAGWIRDVGCDAWVKDIPGYADVLADELGVFAVVVGSSQLTFVRLTFRQPEATYVPDGSPVVWRHQGDTAKSVGNPRWSSRPDAWNTECATIARDPQNHLWIAFDDQQQVLVRRSADPLGREWSEVIPVSQSIDNDDLSVVFPLTDGVGVVWSDQTQDVLAFRRHIADRPPDEWEAIETIATGRSAANDHLSAAVASDGTVYLVTKNSRYVPGQPTLVLRVRNSGGDWTLFPFAAFSEEFTPSRPIVLTDPQANRLWIVHTSMDNSFRNSHGIVATPADHRDIRLPDNGQLLITRRTDLQNATSGKGRLPEGVPGIVLASDRLGNVYEGILPISETAESEP